MVFRAENFYTFIKFIKRIVLRLMLHVCYDIVNEERYIHPPFTRYLCRGRLGTIPIFMIEDGLIVKTTDGIAEDIRKVQRQCYDHSNWIRGYQTPVLLCKKNCKHRFATNVKNEILE